MSDPALQGSEGDAEVLRRLLSGSWRCTSCRELHQGLFDLGCDRPIHCDPAAPIQSNRVAAESRDFLSHDFCVIDGRDFFVRGLLRLRIIGTDSVFSYGVWASLSEANFQHYFKHFYDDDAYGDIEPWFGWFSVSLVGYPDTVNLKCHVWPPEGAGRPLFELEPTDHPLAVEQRAGLTPSRLLEIYRLNGHSVA